MELVTGYTGACRAREPRRLQKVFAESLLTIIVGEVKNSKEWKKREKLMSLVYEF